jgi:hypothetical protein
VWLAALLKISTTSIIVEDMDVCYTIQRTHCNPGACLYDEFAIVHTISFFTLYKMASENIGPFCTSFATIRADGDGVPISFPLGSDGLDLVSVVRLGFRFQLNIASLYIDEEVFDSVSGDVTHMIGQIPVCNGDGKHWLLRPGRFRLYGLSESTMAASTKLAPFLQSSSCTNRIPVSSKVKVEPGVESITILNDDLVVSSPHDAMPAKCRSGNLPSQDVPHESPACTSQIVLQPSLQSQSSVLDCLKRLRFTKGSRNALKKIDYDSVQHLKVDYLPLVFNGDVVFEFPSIRSLLASSQAGLIVGMDKRHDGHVWTRTSTSHIKNDMGLTFHSTSCVGHLRCHNQDCEYLSCIHHTF